MAKNNSSNQDFTNNSDGFDVTGGTTRRKLTATGADITLTGSGTNVYTFPATTDTLVGRASTDTLTGKTLTNPLLTGNSGSPSTPAAGLATLFGVGTSNLRPGWINQGGTSETIITTGGTAGAIRGAVAQRQGGTTGAGSWNTSGTSNTDTSTTPVLVQAGAALSSSSAGVTVTFPTAYSQAPLVFFSPVNGGAVTIAQLTGFPTTSAFTFVCNNNSGTQIAVNTLWYAIGQ